MNYFQQSELPLLADVKRDQEILPERLEHLLEDISDYRQALLFSIQYAKRTQTGVGEDMGIRKSHWSGIINGTKNMSFAAWLRFRQVVGNDLYLQWLAWFAGYRLVKREKSEQERLKAEIGRLQQQLEQAERKAGNEQQKAR